MKVIENIFTAAKKRFLQSVQFVFDLGPDDFDQSLIAQIDDLVVQLQAMSNEQKSRLAQKS